MELKDDQDDLPSLEASIKAISVKKDITEGEAREAVQRELQRGRHFSLKGAAYYYCVKAGIPDQDIDQYDVVEDK